ncbi:Helicase ATP-binding domain-containing protein [Durusdinium trenchii]|uniref:Helicase ATP-binding domain-containing protein n=1 Tax=Durusdinium trenchii TaxID=1381693 RepID=A0ABP0R7U7_9DINO
MGHCQHVPCITPRGEFFHIGQNRYLLDVEKLLFQSFPMVNLNICHLTRRELEDLAGNAMNIRAATAAWLCGLSTLNIDAWNQHGVTESDRMPLPRDPWF